MTTVFDKLTDKELLSRRRHFIKIRDEKKDMFSVEIARKSIIEIDAVLWSRN